MPDAFVDSDGFSEPTPETAFELFRQIGFKPPLHSSDGALPGLEFAGRAEIKFAVLRPGEPFGVSSPISQESKSFFDRLANHRSEAQVITDPTGTYVFQPGAEMMHVPLPKKPWWKFWSK